jgi:hypothetical protein
MSQLDSLIDFGRRKERYLGFETFNAERSARALRPLNDELGRHSRKKERDTLLDLRNVSLVSNNILMIDNS